MRIRRNGIRKVRAYVALMGMFRRGGGIATATRDRAGELEVLPRLAQLQPLPHLPYLDIMIVRLRVPWNVDLKNDGPTGLIACVPRRRGLQHSALDDSGVTDTVDDPSPNSLPLPPDALQGQGHIPMTQDSKSASQEWVEWTQSGNAFSSLT
eukprot:4533283-Amphidinium_carterae.1